MSTHTERQQNSQPHHFPHNAVGHLDAAHQNEHIERQFPDIAPYHGSRRRTCVNGGRGAGEHGEDTQPQKSVEGAVFRQAEFETLRQAIARLPEKQRSRLVLHYLGNFTYEQIVEMEGCSKQTVKFSVDIALKKFFD